VPAGTKQQINSHTARRDATPVGPTSAFEDRAHFGVVQPSGTLGSQSILSALVAVNWTRVRGALAGGATTTLALHGIGPHLGSPRGQLIAPGTVQSLGLGQIDWLPPGDDAACS
jgi:hypothetical protein